MEQTKKIPIESLSGNEYHQLICYPACDNKEFRHRLEELKELKIEAIELAGQKQVGNMPILGKGCVGLVVVAYRKDGKFALKIRRTDANRANMFQEAEMLRIANKVSVGPRLDAVTNDFLLMEYVGGQLLREWIERVEGEKARIRLVLRRALEQCWRLDNAGLDHGQLSNAKSHIIVRADDRPCLLDFESASASRKISNVTSLCQYLFLGSSMAELVQKRLGTPKIKSELVVVLRNYKRKRDRESFRTVLLRCRL